MKKSLFLLSIIFFMGTTHFLSAMEEKETVLTRPTTENESCTIMPTVSPVLSLAGTTEQGVFAGLLNSLVQRFTLPYNREYPQSQFYSPWPNSDWYIYSLKIINNNLFESGTGAITVYKINDEYPIVQKIINVPLTDNGLMDTDGTYIYCGTTNGFINKYNLEGDDRTVFNPNEKQIAFTSNILAYGKDLIASYGPLIIKIWDASTGQNKQTLGYPKEFEQYKGLAIHNGLLFAGSTKGGGSNPHGGTIAGFDPRTGIEVKSYKTGSVNTLAQLNENTLIAGLYERVIQLWDTRKDQLAKTLSGHTADVSAVIRLSDDSLASGSADSTVRIWQKALLNNLDVTQSSTYS